MTPETLDLFRAVVDADASAVQRALAAGADVNATDGKGRNIVSHAALGDAIDAIDAPIQPCLSERRLEILQFVLEHADLSLYSLNAPLPWAGGVTLLGLMSWLNMPTEIMFLLEYTQGLVEVNAMDEQGATPLMYAARDGSVEVVQRLLAHGARPDLRDTSQRSAIQYALPHSQILWLCEGTVRRERAGELQPFSLPDSSSSSGTHSTTSLSSSQHNDLFLATSIDTFLKPPSSLHLDSADLRRTFDALLRATRGGDDVALHALLSPAQLENSRTPSLVNLRDSSGLSLVHHAVSQRRRLDGAVLDALYRAGADVGLFSTLGFSPLHHLARTARDSADIVHGEALVVQSLYTFTMHLLRDLRAPLGAPDAKGETPLHAAAEHGNSRLVLQAMLDYDGMFSRTELVREFRNEKGLRPVEVCRPEFLSLFTREPAHVYTQLRSQNSWDSTLSEEPVPLLPVNSTRTGLPTGRPGSAGRPLDSGRPFSSGRGLMAKTSDGSLQSRSSGSSNTSSGALSHQSPRRPHSRNPGTPLHTHMLPSPSPSGTSLSDHLDAHSSFDIPVYTRDLMSNLSLCAAALQAYSQGQQSTYETDYGDLPDLPALSDATRFTREVGSLVLEHWAARLDFARAEFERARKELDKAQGLREKVGREVSMRLGSSIDDGNRTPGRYQGHVDQGVGTTVRHAGVQTEFSAIYVAHLEAVARLEEETDYRAKRLSMYARLEEAELREPATPERAARVLHLMQERRTEERKLRDAEDEVRVNRWYADSASVGEEIGAPLLLGWVKQGSLPSLEIVKEIESPDASMVGRDVRDQKSVVTKGKLKGDFVKARVTPEEALQNAPRVLQRVEKDLNGIVSQLAKVTQYFIRGQQSVAEASTLLEQALKTQDDRLQALTRAYAQPDSPHPPSSFRLPRLPQRPADPTATSPSIKISSVASSPHQQLSPSTSSSSLHRRYLASGPPIDETHALRQLLTRKIEKHIEYVFHELQKAHVWLRIIREVLRGLRRRAASVDC